MHEEITDGVFLIDTLAAGTPGLVAGYLIKGDRSVLVDAGYPSSANNVLSELKSLEATGPAGLNLEITLLRFANCSSLRGL